MIARPSRIDQSDRRPVFRSRPEATDNHVVETPPVPGAPRRALGLVLVDPDVSYPLESRARPARVEVAGSGDISCRL